MRRIYLNFNEILNKNLYKLDKKNLNYLKNVLRLNNNEFIEVFNGRKAYLAQIKNNEIEIIKEVKQENDVKLKQLKIAVSIIKKERLEWLIEKGTEIGCTEFFLINFKHSQKYSVNLNRLIQISIEACKQSKRIEVPKIYPLMDYLDFIKTINLNEWSLANFNGKSNLNSKVNGIIIGPEGGFSKEELEFKFEVIKLSENVLRVETAAILGLYEISKSFLD